MKITTSINPLGEWTAHDSDRWCKQRSKAL
jgi:hypothetical protein